MFLFRHFLRRSFLNLQEFVAAARKGDERTNKRKGRNVNWRGSETSQRHKKKRHRNFALSTGCFHYITVNDRVADLPFFFARLLINALRPLLFRTPHRDSSPQGGKRKFDIFSWKKVKKNVRCRRLRIVYLVFIHWKIV